MKHSNLSPWQTYPILLCVISAVVVYALSYATRYATYADWLANPGQFVAEDVMPMTTMDAYYWLKMAREIDAGTLGIGLPEPTKGYPDRALLAINDEPGLLAELISFAKSFTKGNYYRAGLLLIPVLSGLFVFPLLFYCHRVGFTASAILGGLVGSFSHAYYIRTMMGRLDTDLLNTFFTLGTACFILPMDRQKDWRANLGLAVGAGLTMSLFVRWYQQPSFILVYLVAMLLYLLVGRLRLTHIALILLAFLLASGPEYALQAFGSLRKFVEAYFYPPPAGLISWPNILNVVSETRAYGIIPTLKNLHGFLPVVFAGFAGLLYLCVRYFKQMIPLSPMIAIGLWSLVGPNRFAMYLAPLLGIGCGVLVELLVRTVTAKGIVKPRYTEIVSLAIMFGLFFSTIQFTRFFYQPQIVVSRPVTQSLLEIKRLVPKHSAMFTAHWGYGYALMEIGDFATFHDGGLHGGLRTTLIAQAIASTRQEDMVSLLAYLEKHGFRNLRKQILEQKLTGEQLLEQVFSYAEKFTGQDVYVLYLQDMIKPLSTLSLFGTWDFKTRQSQPIEYVELNCSSMVDNLLTCEDGIVDLNRGVMQDQIGTVLFREVLFVNNGTVVDRRQYQHDNGYYLQILARDNQVRRVLVADERLFRSNFNQQYLLGNYDRRYFQEVYSNFPVARVLKVKSTPVADGTEPESGRVLERP